MSAELAQHLDTLARDGGFRLHLWSTNDGRFQANISLPQENSWTVEIDEEPLRAVLRVMRQRVSRCVSEFTQEEPLPMVARIPLLHPDDDIAVKPYVDPRQIDIEEAIAATYDAAIDLDDLLG